MMLGELIKALEAADPETVIERGFCNPHSYRGFYTDLAFEPAERVRVGDMLTAARDSLGKTFEGYKGGDYLMKEHTECWIAWYANQGETLGAEWLRLMLAQVVTPDLAPEDVGWRQGRHQPRNIYLDGEYVMVAFSADRAKYVCTVMNAHQDSLIEKAGIARRVYNETLRRNT
jgi:hypothetical protein